MARRLDNRTRARLEALEATADRLAQRADAWPLGDVLALAGATLSEFAADVIALTDPATNDADTAAAAVRVTVALDRGRRRLAGLPDLPDPIPCAEHPHRPGPGWLSDRRHWWPDKAK